MHPSDLLHQAEKGVGCICATHVFNFLLNASANLFVSSAGQAAALAIDPDGISLPTESSKSIGYRCFASISSKRMSEGRVVQGSRCSIQCFLPCHHVGDRSAAIHAAYGFKNLPEKKPLCYRCPFQVDCGFHDLPQPEYCFYRPSTFRTRQCLSHPLPASF